MSIKKKTTYYNLQIVNYFKALKITKKGAGEMVQQLRASAALAEDKGLVSSIHT